MAGYGVGLSWETEDHFQEPVLSFLRVSLEDRTQVARLRRQGLDSLSHLAGLRSAF